MVYAGPLDRQLNSEGPESNKPLVLDVRSFTEFESDHIEGVVNIPLDGLRARLDELPRDWQIASYCLVGLRGYSEARLLQQQSFDAVNLSGGYKTYEAELAAR